ncbi:MAG: acyl carrier protein [Bacteroidia bacterium]|nr:acyl carrier protein [Methylotenera sp.]
MSLQIPSHEEVFQRMTNLIADKINVDKSSIHFDSNLNELGLDSLDTFNLIFGAEDYYKIKVPSGKIDIVTVSDVTALVHQLVMKKKINAPIITE